MSTHFHKVFLLTLVQNILSIGAKKSKPMYDGINQLEEVMKNAYFVAIGSWQMRRQISLITIQNRQMKARLIRLLFFGVAEKYPVIRINTLTPIIENPSNK